MTALSRCNTTRHVFFLLGFSFDLIDCIHDFDDIAHLRNKLCTRMINLCQKRPSSLLKKFAELLSCFADESTESSNFLSSLMGAGCECDGYRLCIVGHSLGGAIATMLGLRVCSITCNIAKLWTVLETMKSIPEFYLLA